MTVSTITKKDYAYYSARYLERFTQTKSLAKLENIVKEAGEDRITFVACGYVFYNKMDKLNRIKHPTLYSYVNKFIEQKDSVQKLNDWAKVISAIENIASKKEILNKSKERLRKYVIDFLEDNDISLNLLISKTNIKYANAYNFVKKGQLNYLSNDKIGELLDAIDRIK